MSSHGDSDGPKFGHIFEVFDEDEDAEGPEGSDLRDKIKKGEIEDLDDLEEETGSDFLRPIMGDPFKTVKLSTDSQGTPMMFILSAADKFDDDWDWTSKNTMEQMFVSPESNLHNEFMQRRQQAEQNVKQTMQGLEQLRKSKHLLQHDIRKLRSKVEDLKSGEEATIKGDFIELVDGAGQSPRQGGDQMSLKSYRDQNIYPSIVADFNEMQSVEDLEEDGPLADIPENEKAILKKKFTMYEKWKDLYGSEIERKLEDLKKELRRVETALEEQKKQTAPYVRDMVMINQKDQDELAEDISRYMAYRGYSTQFQEKEFICYKPHHKHHGELEETDDEDHATHYKIFYIHAVHVNIAGAENPNTPAEGPTIAKVFWFPAVVDKFIFENFFKAKIEKKEEQFKNLMQDYTGDFKNEKGEEFKEHREEEGLSVRELREKVGEEIRSDPPLDFSSTIRRIEDGFDRPEKIEEKYGKNYLEAIDDILGTSYSDDDEEENQQLSEIKRELKLFTGQEDEYYLESPEDELYGLTGRFKFNYYWDLKINMGMYTVK